MAATLPASGHDAVARIRGIQIITVIWMSIEAGFSLAAALNARSPALLAFGGDSAVELMSALVVLWRFQTRAPAEGAERRAARMAAILLFVLAAYVVATAGLALLGYSQPQPTRLGIAILVAAAVIMPWLARGKRRLAAVTQSAALRADATQSGLCAYLSLIALAGLALNAMWQLRWADPLAGLAITPLIVWEGREAWRGKACDCC